MKKQIKLGLLKSGGVITSLAPLITAISINWNKYVMATNGDTVRLTVGGVIAVLLITLSTLGKLKLPNKTMFFTIVLVLVFLLEPILADLKLLCACALGGELLNDVSFNLLAKNYAETITMEKQADINAAAMVKAQQESETTKKSVSGRV